MVIFPKELFRKSRVKGQSIIYIKNNILLKKRTTIGEFISVLSIKKFKPDETTTGRNLQVQL